MDHLPANVRQLTAFGERPDWSHDGRRLLFLSKVFGDVYELEIATGRITPVTEHFRHHGFTRALYLSNGDVLLSGPVQTFDRVDKDARQKARSASHLFVLDRSFTRPPVALGVHCDEGPAVSRRRLRIAWTHGRQDRISTAEIAYVDGTPKLVDVQPVLAVADFPAADRPQRWIETQSFVPPDDARLTVTGYEMNGTANSECFALDLATRTIVNASRSPDHYEECEGVFGAQDRDDARVGGQVDTAGRGDGRRVVAAGRAEPAFEDTPPAGRIAHDHDASVLHYVYSIAIEDR